MVTGIGIFTIEYEYKVLCALSNSAAFDDLQRPRTPVSRSQYSLNANISQTVHPIHSMFGSRVGFSGTAELMVQLSNFKHPRWRYTRTAVARNPCVSWAFVLFLVLFFVTVQFRPRVVAKQVIRRFFNFAFVVHHCSLS